MELNSFINGQLQESEVKREFTADLLEIKIVETETINELENDSDEADRYISAAIALEEINLLIEDVNNLPNPVITTATVNAIMDAMSIVADGDIASLEALTISDRVKAAIVFLKDIIIKLFKNIFKAFGFFRSKAEIDQQKVARAIVRYERIRSSMGNIKITYELSEGVGHYFYNPNTKRVSTAPAKDLAAFAQLVNDCTKEILPNLLSVCRNTKGVEDIPEQLENLKVNHVNMSVGVIGGSVISSVASGYTYRVESTADNVKESTITFETSALISELKDLDRLLRKLIDIQDHNEDDFKKVNDGVTKLLQKAEVLGSSEMLKMASLIKINIKNIFDLQHRYADTLHHIVTTLTRPKNIE